MQLGIVTKPDRNLRKLLILHGMVTPMKLNNRGLKLRK